MTASRDPLLLVVLFCSVLFLFNLLSYVLFDLVFVFLPQYFYILLCLFSL